MKTYEIAGSSLKIPVVGLGCMRLGGMEISKAETLISTSVEHGINFFDHADIYGRNYPMLSEEVFSRGFRKTRISRDSIILQSKCGIRKDSFNLSKEYILSSVDGILQRLECEYLDILLLHRPDALVEPEEVAESFSQLEQSGKVRYFGVSNHNPMQIELLKKTVKQPLLFNQLQLSIMRTGMIDAGLNVNMKVPGSVDHDGSVLDYCRLNDITVQAWSPFQYGFFEGVFVDNAKFPELNKVLSRVAEKYSVSSSVIALSWILRHPAGIQAITGSTNPVRVAELAEAGNITISREEWYEIYCSAGNVLP